MSEKSERDKLYESNVGIIKLATRDSEDPIERDIAWTLKYVQDAHPWACVSSCIGGLALAQMSRPIQEALPERIREYAHAHQTGDQLADWVNAQKYVASYWMPIGRRSPHERLF